MPIISKRNWMLPLACGLLGLLILTLVLVISLTPEPIQLHTYHLRDGALSQVIHTEQTDPYLVLTEAGLSLDADDQLEITRTDEDVTDLTIQRCATATVQHDGQTQTVSGFDLTVGEALAQLSISYDSDDQLSPSAETPLSDGMEIVLVRMEYQTNSSEHVLPMETIETVDPALAPDEIVVDAEGSDGLERRTSTITFEDGFIIDQSETTEILIEPVARVIRKGISHEVVEGSTTLETQKFTAVSSSSSKPSSSGSSSSSGNSGSSGNSSSYSNASPVSSSTGGVLTTASGTTYSYTKVLACSATAYTTEGYTEKHNASGNIARVGTVAVDPKVIPLGTALYIVTDDGEYIYGYCVAEDTGGAVKGNIVDLFFDTLAECYAFGRRNCTVYVLG